LLLLKSFKGFMTFFSIGEGLLRVDPKGKKAES